MRKGRGNLMCSFLLFFSFFVLFPLNAISLTATGYGDTMESAKSNALKELSADFIIHVSSVTTTEVDDSNNNDRQLYSRDVSISSDFTFIGVQYIDLGETKSKEEKSKGKFYCSVMIDDKDADKYVKELSNIVYQINEYYGLYLTQPDLYYKDWYLSQIEELLSNYDSYYYTLQALRYKGSIPVYSREILPSQIHADHNNIKQQMAYSTQVSSFEANLIENIWSKNSDSVDIYEAKTYDGLYNKDYKIGDFGPAGGIIFYVKDEASDGWKYLEVSSKDLSSKYEFGKMGKIATEDGLGKGDKNTSLIINSNNSSTKTAAKVASEYREGGFSDWYLPSIEELTTLFKNLKRNKNFKYQKSGYWSSSVLSASFAKGHSFKSQKTFTDSMTSLYFVRPIRKF